ncbi:MAG: SET domain-containing protein-lysine N-methyltransferase [Planctomycetaceae bacterium]|nr:SET domain-containing protein-lysine N-methyltransferase [Planctomycetaceae bacterium]
MPTDSQSATVRRQPSDLGAVFPSGVQVGQTPYGFGVFAFAFIPGGTPIARVSGNIFHNPDYSSDYCIDAGDGKVLEPAPPFCYLNHSCEPNCELMVYVEEEEPVEVEPADEDCIYGSTDDGAPDDTVEEDENEEDEDEEDEDEETEDESEPEVWVEAIRDILPNEELTIDYSWPADRAAKCLCGKPQCRGWIVDPAERDQLPDA